MEVLFALFIVVLVFGAIINGYLVSSIRGQWTGYSLAAQSLGLQTLERVRSATWDIATGNNQVTNLTLYGRSWDSGTQTLTGYTTNILGVPYKSSSPILATNNVTIQTLYENNNSGLPVQIMLIRVDTIWPFTDWGKFNVNYYTNTVLTYQAPDNRDPTTLGATPSSSQD